MKHKSIAITLITVLLCMIVGNNVACTTPVVEYQLTISSTEGGSVTTPGEGSYTYCQDQGLTVDLVAIPDPGYQFVNWTGNVDTIADVDDPTTTITVNDDYSITANFVKQYRLTIYTSGGGSVTAPGEGTYTYDAGTRINLVAQANAGYQFVNWVGTVGTIANVGAATTTITMNDDCSIAANFIKKQYRLTISSTAGGSVTTPGQGVFTRDAGTVVNLVASPAAGYRFVNWTGNVGTVANVSAASTTITMNGEYSITANFVKQYALTISATTGGSVTTPGVGTHTYNPGTVVNLVATPDAGYQFVNWTGNVGTIGDVNAAITTITMNNDYSITANFVAVYELTISSTEGGNVTTPGEGTYTYRKGELVNLVAEVDTGCRFVNWTGDVSAIADVSAATTTITMNGSYSITANFVRGCSCG